MQLIDKYEYCGMIVRKDLPQFDREVYFIQMGGEWTKKDGAKAGKGNFYHYQQAIRFLWPEIDQHRWFLTFLEEWLAHNYIGVMGPRNSSKSFSAAVVHLLDYYCFSNSTTCLVCSTTRERLEDRIWGDIKKLHRVAKSRCLWLSGNLIEGRQRIVTDDRTEQSDGRDFRNGMLGVPCKRGDKFVGISDFQGIKNKRIRLVGDELAALPKTFIDAIATLDIQGEVKVTGLGNPAQTTDALGVLCEPHVTLGGWEGGIDQGPKTKTWKTRFDNGVAVQFPGSDSPNMDVPADVPPPYPYLMTREAMERDKGVWGADDWHFLMFNEGRMPRGQGSRRVITRQLCLKSMAMEAPVWMNGNLTYITCLDAAYRAVGGDRCVLMRLAFGPEITPETDLGTRLAESLINQAVNDNARRIVLAVLETIIVPIKSSEFESPEDQIAVFVKQKHEGWNIPPANFFFDAGMRTSLVSAFARIWSNQVNTIDFGGKPSERQVSAEIKVLCSEYYSKFVTELWWSCRLAIEAKQVRGMSEDLVAEGCAREWKTVGSNKIEVETKDDMKAKMGKSPDLFDCFAIGVEGARRKGFVIAKLSNSNGQREQDQRWKNDLRERARKAWRSHDLIEV